MDGITRQLRPMTVGDLLDTVFALYRRNFALFAGVVAVVAIPQAIISLELNLATPSTPYTTGSGDTFTFDFPAFAAFAAFGLAGILISFILNTIATGALATAISARYLGRPITVNGAYRAGGSAFFRLLIATVLETIILLFSLVFLIIPAIYLYVRFIFLPQAVVLERQGIVGGLGRSGQLVQGSWWRVFGIALILFILAAILQSTVSGVVGLLAAFGHGFAARLVGVAANALTTIAVQPVQLGGLTLLYYDLRIRKEGFDLEQMARDLESSAAG